MNRYRNKIEGYMTRVMTPLPYRGVLEIQGEDKAIFLQGLISNDIRKVTPQQAIYATLLSPQGRFLYDFFISEKEGSYFLDGEKDRLDSLLKKLSLYKLRASVSFTLRPDLNVYALWGENIATSLGLTEEKGNAKENLYMDPRLLDLGARSIGEVGNKDFQLVSPRDYDLHRLVLGVPEGGRDLIPEKAILLECGLDELNAISWTKGCYIGQELTARTKHRGLVRKRLFPVQVEGSPPSEGAEISLNGERVGRMYTHVGATGLSLLRLEAFQAYQEGKGELICEMASLKPYIPLWMILEEPS